MTQNVTTHRRYLASTATLTARLKGWQARRNRRRYALVREGADVLLVIGASAVVDRGDGRGIV